MEKSVEEMLKNLYEDSKTIVDERARANYVSAVAKLKEIDVQEKSLEDEHDLKEKEIEVEKRKADGDVVSKVFDTVVKATATIATSLLTLGLYKQCWDQGFEYEKTGIISSTMLKDHIRSFKLKLW